jgi:hypothetical protein
VKLFEIEIGRSYRCDFYGLQYFGPSRRSGTGRSGWLSVTRLGPIAIPAIRWPRGSLLGLHQNTFIPCDRVGRWLKRPHVCLLHPSHLRERLVGCDGRYVETRQAGM